MEFRCDGTSRNCCVPDGSTIYMSNRTAGTVLKKKPETGANTGSWSVGSGTSPAGIALSPDGATMYVPQNASAGIGADKLTVRTASNGTLQKTWDFAKGSRPRSAAVSPDGTQVYVALEGGNRIAVMNAADGKEVTSWDLASLGATTPGYLALSKNGDRLYVVTVNPTGVLVLNTKDGSAIEKWTDGFKSAFGIAAATCGQTVFVSDWTNPGNVQAVDQPNQCVETVTVTGIKPNSGPDSGGTQVTVTGSGFVAGRRCRSAAPIVHRKRFSLRHRSPARRRLGRRVWSTSRSRTPVVQRERCRKDSPTCQLRCPAHRKARRLYSTTRRTSSQSHGRHPRIRADRRSFATRQLPPTKMPRRRTSVARRQTARR